MLFVRDLSVEYAEVGRTTYAVSSVSLDVPGGSVVGLVGESGSGKSTLALAILGLTRERGRIVAGEVEFDGADLLGLSDGGWRAVRGGQIGLVPQNPRGALDPVERVGTQIEQYYLAHREATTEEARARALELLTLVGINDPERRPPAFPHELSGGMAQRVLIAMALSCSPKLLIADEPTSGLDVTIQAEVLDDMRRSVEAVGSSLLVITQDLGIVANYCDRVYIMHAGEIAEEAPVERFFENATHPATVALLAAQGQHYEHERVRLRGLPVDTRNLPSGCYLHRRCQFADQAAGCYDTRPPLTDVLPEHRVRCHRFEEIPDLAGRRADTDTPAGRGTGSRSPTSAASNGALLSVEGLVKHFAIPGSDAYVQACEDVSFDVQPGETLGVVGESGSGKTTLGRCILRLLEPTRGKVVFDGRDLEELTKSELRRLRKDMQIVYQEPFDSLNPLLSIGRQIGEPLKLHSGLSRGDRKERVLELLGLVGLPGAVADSVPQGLSPGTLQRCSIARAIATNPKLIVLDEPTSALPPEAEADIIRLLNDLQQRLGLAYIFISHDLALVREFCNRVVVMYLSQIVEMGTQEELFARPRHPYSRALLASVLTPNPRAKRDVGARAERLEGEIPSPIDLPTGCYLASRCHFVRDRCHVEPQELQPLVPGHDVRCWRVSENDLTEAEIEESRRKEAADASPSAG